MWEASLSLTALVWVAIDIRALGEKYCSLHKRCCLGVISGFRLGKRVLQCQPCGRILRRLNCHSIDLSFSDLVLS